MKNLTKNWGIQVWIIICVIAAFTAFISWIQVYDWNRYWLSAILGTIVFFYAGNVIRKGTNGGNTLHEMNK